MKKKKRKKEKKRKGIKGQKLRGTQMVKMEVYPS